MNGITRNTPATEGQKRENSRFLKEAFQVFQTKLQTMFGEINTEDAQRFLDNGDKFKAYTLKTILDSFRRLSVSDQYKDEEVDSSYGYPDVYRGLKPIGVQVDILTEEFNLSLDYVGEFIEKVLPTLSLPEGTDWAAIPSVDAVAKRFFPEVTDQAEKYYRAVELILEKLGKTRNFHNYREGEFNTRQLRQHARTLHALNLIAETQKGDILIIPMQYGMRHRGRSVRRAREYFSENGFGAFAVCCMAFTHPERYVKWEELHTDCPGDEFAPGAVGDFSCATRLDFFGGMLYFGTCPVSDARGRFGSVTGFLPQG
ncbi:hypothetical protein AUJ77_03760 [Candidatus Nomurabacteria bacterium CG1_02_43_90]|uniref:Uncharacterized protein n=1 Tax=Candidatus Nomurabacteria bacterium CG1_02_43_90 TaxID=1805281 RepID=A0A1J4V6M4_9BACT|nr:MAG: hypothetical protein AUJ77_03760 [Candidatus Nomurabacteria bacterium CG1_02_43_90]